MGGKKQGGHYISPGVYVEEVPATTRPIEGVGTAIAAFVGFAPNGPFSTPLRRTGVLVVTGAAFAVTYLAVRRRA